MTLIETEVIEISVPGPQGRPGAPGPSDHGDLDGLDAVDSHPASAVSFSPSGSVDSTDLQGAVSELANEAVISLQIRQIVQITQAAYDLITPDPETMYVIVD